MPIAPDILSKIGDLQKKIWQTAALKACEAAEFEINLTDPLTTLADAADLTAEVANPKLVVQFTFSGILDNPMMILIPQDTLGSLVESLSGKQPETIDETHIAEVQPTLDAIVQGICVSIGNIRNEEIVTSDLKMKFQIPSLPKNLQANDDLIRVNVGFGCEDFNGTLTWIMDEETAYHLLGIAYEGSQTNVFAPLSESEGHAALSKDLKSIDEKGLEIIMDIPLEVSVELGRVKMQVREVVELGAGSIVEIDKTAGEPVDVMVNGRLVARGEVVVIDDNFGVRITEILSIQERLQKLNEAA